MKLSRIFLITKPILLVFALLILGSSSASANDFVPQWVRTFNGPANNFDTGNSIAVDGSGNVIIAGSTYSDASSNDFYVAKYAAASGAILWEKYYNGPANSEDSVSRMALDAAGNVFVTGSSWGERNHPDFYTAKYAAADGALLWEKRFTTGPNGFNIPGALVVDAAGNVAVTGYASETDSNHYDVYTIKYSGADGTVLWQQVYDGPDHLSDNPAAIVVDANGDFIVDGSSISGSLPAPVQANYDIFTVKYAGTDGTVLWQRRYAGPDGGPDNAYGLAVAPNGDVAISGTTYSDLTSHDFYIARYAGATGALLWEKRYNSSQGAVDFPASVKFDSLGNVIVTGSVDPGGNPDMYTVKYNAANGAVIWEKRYDGPTHKEDYGSTVLIDSADNVTVVGSTVLAFRNGDIHIARYAAANGALLLDKRYNGPGNSSEYGGPSVFTPDGGLAILGTVEIVVGNQGINDLVTIKYLPSATTESPALLAPATGSAIAGTIAVNYYLPDTAANGTVKLTFTGSTTTILTLANADGSSGAHSFNLTATNLNAPAHVAAVSGPTALNDGIYTITLSYQDLSGDAAGSATSTNVRVDPTAPALTVVNIASDNANPAYAKVANTITLTFTADEAIQTPTGSLLGQSATFKNTGGNTWQATQVVGVASAQGPVLFSITAKDLLGNVHPAVTTTTDGSSVTVDRTAPVLTLSSPNPQTVEGGTTYVEPGATATDTLAGNLDGVIQVTGMLNTNVVGTYTRTYTVADFAGNTAIATRTVNVVDTTPPSIVITGANPAAAEAGLPYQDAGATAQDTVAGNLTGAIQVAGSVNTQVVGDYSVTYTVSDGFNTALASRVVKVRDTTAPSITLLGVNPTVIEAGTTYNDAGATASDTFLGNLSGTIQTTGNVDIKVVGDYTVTYTVSDGFNTVSAVRTVKVRDTILPVITILGDNPVTVTAYPYNDAGATAHDTVAGNLTPAIQVASNVNARAVGDYTVTYTVTDGYNTAVAARTVKVRDTVQPAITILGANPLTIEAGVPYHDAGATASDAIAGDLTAAIQTSSTVNINAVGYYEVTYTVTDGSFTSTTKRIVQVVDTTGPQITHIPDPISVKADQTNHATVPDFTVDLTVTDNIAVTQTTQDPPAGTVVGFGSYQITLTIEDAAHNSSTCTTTFTVEDGPALSGRYAGLLADAQGAIHAFLEVKLTPGRMLTGQVLLDNGRLLALPNKSLPSTTNARTYALTPAISLALTFDGYGHVAATLTTPATVLTADAVLANAQAPSGVPGIYTAILDPGTGNGPGWLRAVVSANGAIRMTGKLPDGSTVVAGQGAIVDRHGDALVFLLGNKVTHPLLAGRIHFADLTASDFAGNITFNGATCAASGAKFAPAPSALPTGSYPLTLTAPGVNIASTVTLRARNNAAVIAPLTSFQPLPATGLPASGLFQLTSRNPVAPFGPLLKGTGVFYQKLGIGAGQFKAAGAIGKVQLGTP